MKDKNDFVKKFNNLTVPKDSILVIMDVKSLKNIFLAFFFTA